MARLPPLNALRAFEVCSRRMSFTAAAEELCISQGAVSRHIALLEKDLQVRLFERGHRQVTLTRHGTIYAERIHRFFHKLEIATETVRTRPHRQVIKILLFPTVAARWFMPRIQSFHEANPDIDLEIRTSPMPTEADRADVDFFNLHGPINDPRYFYRPIIDIVLKPICAPRLMHGTPPLRRPSDLSGHVMLHSLNRRSDWPSWLKHAGAQNVSLSRSLEFDNTALACEAAMGGLGVAMGIGDIFRDEIEAGRLEEPFPFSLRTGETYGFAWRRAHNETRHFGRFLEWLAAQSELSAQPHLATAT